MLESGHSIFGVNVRIGAMAFGAIVFASSAPAAINLEFRPTVASVLPSQTIGIQLFAVSDSQSDQLLSAAQVIFAWQPQFLTLTGNSTAGAPPLTFSGFPTTGSFGLNELPVPQDGDAFYLALSFSPIAATPAGTLLTTLNFTAINPVASTPISMLLTGGQGAQTIVASGTVPGLDVTGTLTGTSIQIVPAPAGLGAICIGCVAFGTGRRRRR